MKNGETLKLCCCTTVLECSFIKKCTEVLNLLVVSFATNLCFRGTTDAWISREYFCYFKLSFGFRNNNTNRTVLLTVTHQLWHLLMIAVHLAVVMKIISRNEPGRWFKTDRTFRRKATWLYSGSARMPGICWTGNVFLYTLEKANFYGCGKMTETGVI